MLVLACLGSYGCGGAGAMTLVEPRNVPGSDGGPSVSKVTDMGDLGSLPALGSSLPPLDSDGTFSVGELVLIEGSDFGRQPTINIGGRPASALGRTGSGAIIARIPAGVPTGSIEVEVSHPGGKGAKAIEVRRYAVVVAGDGVHVMVIGAGGEVSEAGKLAVAGARDVAISSDGSAAYVAAAAAGGERSARLVAISLVASGGPKLGQSQRLPGTAATHVVTADAAQLGVVVGGGRLIPFDTSVPRAPALYEEVAVGDGEIADVALHPEGRSLGVLFSDNRLVIAEVARPDAVKVGDAVDLLPGERMPLGRDLGWSPAGDELWVLVGDGAESLRVGPHAPRMLTVAVASAPEVKAQAEVVGVDAPLALAVARRESVQAATAIRSTARKAALVVASVERGLVAPGGGKDVLATPHPFGQLVRTDLEGKGQAIWSGEHVVGDVELSQDVKYVIAVSAQALRGRGEVGWEMGVDVVPLAGGKGQRVTFGKVTGLGGAAAVAVSP